MAGGFDSLGLMPELLRAVDELDWSLPTDIQDEAIPLIMGGGDVMAAAETGSGKTAAFCLPMIQCVHERLREMSAENEKDKDKDKDDPGSKDDGGGTIDVKLSINDKDNMLSLTNDGYEAIGQAEKQWTGARASHGVKTGKYYYEANVLSGGICRLGYSTMAAHLELGRDAHGYGFGGTGMKSYNNSFEKWGETYGNGDILGCHIDLTDTDNGKNQGSISYTKNGNALGVAFKIPKSQAGTVFFPALVLKGARVMINFGQTAFKHAPTTGYHSLVNPLNKSDIVAASSKQAFVTSGKRLPLAIILLPARDLAEQVYQGVKDMTKYVSEPSLNSILIIGGGDDNKKLKRELDKGVDIVVGTTGKVSDMLKSGSLSLANVKFFILDEADRMVDDNESMKSIMHLYSACPGGGTGDNRLQVCFFSATLHSPAIKELAEKVCVNPTWVDLKGFESVPDTVHHVVYKVDPVKDGHLLTNAKTQAVLDDIHDDSDATNAQAQVSKKLKELKPQVLLGIIDKFEMTQCMIFCRTNIDCDNLESFLTAHGGGSKFRGRVESGKEHKYSCCVLAGMRSMNERRAALEAFKEGEVRFLICTDVAARGIDIKNLPYVINMTLPDEAENYIHRIGRVGRAERMGLAISIVAGTNTTTGKGIREKVWYHKCKNRGAGCTNRKLASAGGCTIDYDEPSMLKAVEARLHMDDGIPEVSPEFELPKCIADLKTEYGELEQAPRGGQTNLHIDLLRPAVAELGVMEVSSQSLFHSLQSQFGRFESNDEAYLREHPNATSY
jgi:ATP-dependent RNA helicase DDX1